MTFDAQTSGPVGKVASWIEYPFASANFPWTAFLLASLLIVLIIFFTHDGLSVIQETVGEVIPQ